MLNELTILVRLPRTKKDLQSLFLPSNSIEFTRFFYFPSKFSQTNSYTFKHIKATSALVAGFSRSFQLKIQRFLAFSIFSSNSLFVL